jgi:hypothetical protein
MYRTVKLLARGNVPTSPLTAGAVLTTDTTSARNGSCNFYFEICLTGATSARPKAGDPDFSVGIAPNLWYYDTTIAAFTVFDGQTWRNPVTGAAN